MLMVPLWCDLGASVNPLLILQLHSKSNQINQTYREVHLTNVHPSYDQTNC